VVVTRGDGGGVRTVYFEGTGNEHGWSLIQLMKFSQNQTYQTYTLGTISDKYLGNY
jgi:hypothetical protein